MPVLEPSVLVPPSESFRMCTAFRICMYFPLAALVGLPKAVADLVDNVVEEEEAMVGLVLRLPRLPAGGARDGLEAVCVGATWAWAGRRCWIMAAHMTREWAEAAPGPLLRIVVSPVSACARGKAGLSSAELRLSNESCARRRDDLPGSDCLRYGLCSGGDGEGVRRAMPAGRPMDGTKCTVGGGGVWALRSGSWPAAGSSSSSCSCCAWWWCSMLAGSLGLG